MKKFIILLSISCLALYSYGQDLGKSLDYQYQRVGNIYQAYSLHASTSRLPHTLNLALFANNELKELKTIQIKLEKNTIKLPFKKTSINIENDDKTLNQMALNVDFNKLPKINGNCELKIVFIFIDKTQFELPLNYCAIKEYL